MRNARDSALPSPAASGRAYDALYERSPFGDSMDFYRRVVDRAAPPPDMPVLDVGCGCGGALTALTQRGARPWGVDVSRAALREARRRAPHARLVLADGAALPFPDASFPLVLSLGNLEHFTELEAGIREMRRVLRTGGTAWVMLPNLFYSGALWRVLRTGYGPDHHQPIDRFATVNEWRDLLEAGGLVVERIIPYHRGKWWKRLLPARLAWHFLYMARAGDPSGRTPLEPLTRARRALPKP